MYGDKKAFIWRDGELDWILNYSFHNWQLEWEDSVELYLSRDVLLCHFKGDL